MTNLLFSHPSFIAGESAGLDRLERDFMFNSNRMQELSNDNRRGSSEYWRLHEECKGINDTIRELLQEL